MSAFDRIAGLSEGASALSRRPLITLGEAGGDKKSTPDAVIDYSDGPPPKFMHGDPNTRYRPQPAPAYGTDGTMGGEAKRKAAALRTSKPAQYNTK